MAERMEMKLVICGDNPADIDDVTGLIDVWKRQAGTAVEVLSFPSAEALLYLLKPVTQERLGQVLDRARSRITNREHMLQLTLQDGVVCLPVNEIRYPDGGDSERRHGAASVPQA